ncbi:MAG: leucine dehydrogenase [Clostridia bacterium]|jgi:leucine dehydrogenase|nr:leucine dehydrogenase [Clostridia bacterium]MDN5323081.1 leucine dehydrogenase [Clostridia bacterium]
MKIFEYLQKYDYEQVVLCQDETSGLKAIIAIHDTTLGPALGGTRFWTYATEEEAIVDALRLSRGMTYKNAAAGLNIGGGKTVIIGDPYKDKSEALFRAFGRFVHSLGGRYITAEDVGTTVQDMEYIRMETPYVCGIVGQGGSGDPSPATAYGVWQGIKACAMVKWQDNSLKNKVIAVQGLGNVGKNLCRHLAEEGAKLIVTDINEKNVEIIVDLYGAEAVKPDEVYSVECDIFAPCALGAGVNDNTIDLFKCSIIAGAANNVLQNPEHGDALDKKGILYAPDFVINAGGVINVAEELNGYNKEKAYAKIAKIYDNVLGVFKIAERDGIPTYLAAERLAEERINKIGKVRNTYVR